MTFRDEPYTSASNSAKSIDPLTSKPDARVGKTDIILSAEQSGCSQLDPHLKAIALSKKCSRTDASWRVIPTGGVWATR
jgi:hypothetical protein